VVLAAHRDEKVGQVRLLLLHFGVVLVRYQHRGVVPRVLDLEDQLLRLGKAGECLLFLGRTGQRETGVDEAWLSRMPLGDHFH
jgi:hypothetical protein